MLSMFFLPAGETTDSLAMNCRSPCSLHIQTAELQSTAVLFMYRTPRSDVAMSGDDVLITSGILITDKHIHLFVTVVPADT